MAEWPADVITGTGARLRDLRREHRLTLADVEVETGISRSTISRLESGLRRANLELLLPLARVYRVTLDELVDPFPDDPRVKQRPLRRDGWTMVPLTRRAGGIQSYKMVIPGGHHSNEPQPRAHEGYEWLYILSGRLRLVLGEHDLELGPGEVAEFDTRLPHWFGNASPEPVEFLSLFGAQGERAHIRARSTTGNPSVPIV